MDLLEGLSGANSSRILLAGMLADVMWEVSSWVHAADEDDPDPWVVAHSFDRLWERLRLLFQHGWIVSEKNQESFTKSVSRFLRKTKVLHVGNRVYTFSFAEEALKSSLTRVNILIQALEKLQTSVRSPDSWLSRFMAYQLPNPWSPTAKRSFDHRQLEQGKAQVKEQLMAIWKQAGLDLEPCWREFLHLLPSAERHRQAGSTVKSAWALASRDFPEMACARRLVAALVCQFSQTSPFITPLFYLQCLLGLPSVRAEKEKQTHAYTQPDFS